MVFHGLHGLRVLVRLGWYVDGVGARVITGLISLPAQEILLYA